MSATRENEPTWAASVSARAFGVRFGVRVTDAPLLEKLLVRLPPGCRLTDAAPSSVIYSVVTSAPAPDGPGAPIFQVLAGSELIAETSREAEALDAFEGIVRFDVAQYTPRWTFVHAGAVGWNGRAILIPGSSYSGKSTLVHALVRAGATYYSDEFAVLDWRGRLHAFTSPLALRRPEGGADRITASELSGALPTPVIPVGLVVATRFVAGAKWSPSRVSPADGLLSLLQHTVRAQTDPARALAVLARAVDAAVIVGGDRGDAGDTAGKLLEQEWLEPAGLRETA